MSHSRNGFSRLILLVAAGLLVASLAGAAAAQGLNVTMMPMPEVAADGQPRGVNFVVTQANGMLAADAAIPWSHVDKGTLAGCQAAGAGILACTYTPPADGAAGQAVLMIDVTSAGTKTSAHFTIPLVAAQVAAPAPAPVAPAPLAPPPPAPPPPPTPPPPPGGPPGGRRPRRPPRRPRPPCRRRPRRPRPR